LQATGGLRGRLTAAPLPTICSRAVAGELTLEIIEGPGAGKQLTLNGPAVIGRAEDADLVLEDGEVSRHHARITPHGDGSATLEDLGSANGTFVNHNELIGPARIDSGDELLLGVTVIQVTTPQDFRARGSGVVQIPPALATVERPPTYVNPEVVRTEAVREERAAGPAGHPSVEKYLDVKVRRRAQLAPLALVVLIAIVLILVFALK
jgi:pSer/pThr/pTyr-binding forkhead associated (FHA) protein